MVLQMEFSDILVQMQSFPTEGLLGRVNLLHYIRNCYRKEKQQMEKTENRLKRGNKRRNRYGVGIYCHTVNDVCIKLISRR